MISTGLEKLDEFLKGGIRGGLIIDIFGAHGTGKTHLAIQICIDSLTKGGTVLFLDTTGQFRPERMHEIIKARGLDPALLDGVKVGRITNTAEQFSYLAKIKEGHFSLVVIDNVTDLFSFEYDSEKQTLEKNTRFMEFMHDLSYLAIQKNIPIVVTNIIRKVKDVEFENMDKPIKMYTHIKIKLTKSGAKFSGEFFPSLLKRREFFYKIAKEGLVEA